MASNVPAKGTTRLTTLENESPGERFQLFNREYASSSRVIVFMRLFMHARNARSIFLQTSLLIGAKQTATLFRPQEISEGAHAPSRVVDCAPAVNSECSARARNAAPETDALPVQSPDAAPFRLFENAACRFPKNHFIPAASVDLGVSTMM